MNQISESNHFFFIIFVRKSHSTKGSTLDLCLWKIMKGSGGVITVLLCNFRWCVHEYYSYTPLFFFFFLHIQLANLSDSPGRSKIHLILIVITQKFISFKCYLFIYHKQKLKCCMLSAVAAKNKVCVLFRSGCESKHPICLRKPLVPERVTGDERALD